MTRQSHSVWSVGLGHWSGATIGVHLSLLLLLTAIGAISAAIHQAEVGGVIALVLVVSLVLHELVHILCAWQLGGYVDSVVLGPVGGMRQHMVPEEPEPRLLLALAGPILHLSMVVVSVGTLVYAGESELLTLLCPLVPLGLLGTADPIGLLAVKGMLWVNWTLLVLNVLPASPFDGAHALRALIWPIAGLRTAVAVTCRAAWGIALLFMLACCYLIVAVPGEPLATGLLFALGMYLAVAARRDELEFEQEEADRDDDNLLGLDDELAQVDWYDEESGHMVLVEQHYDQLRERYERQRKAREDYEDARVDDILARLFHDGYETLTPEDQAFLRRASQRYRQRLGDQGRANH